MLFVFPELNLLRKAVSYYNIGQLLFIFSSFLLKRKFRYVKLTKIEEGFLERVENYCQAHLPHLPLLRIH
jgi:hypothetical protein